MRLRLLLALALGLLLPGCILFVDPNQSCVDSPDVCQPGDVCNPKRGICEPIGNTTGSSSTGGSSGSSGSTGSTGSGDGGH